MIDHWDNDTFIVSVDCILSFGSCLKKSKTLVNIILKTLLLENGAQFREKVKFQFFSFISFKKVKYYLIVNGLFFVEKGAQFRKKKQIEYHV